MDQPIPESVVNALADVSAKMVAKRTRKARKTYKRKVEAMRAELAAIKQQAELVRHDSEDSAWLGDAGSKRKKPGDGPDWYNDPSKTVEGTNEQKHYAGIGVAGKSEAAPVADERMKPQPLDVPAYAKSFTENLDQLTRSVAALIAKVASHADRIVTAERHFEKMCRDLEKRRAALETPVTKSQYSGYSYPDSTWQTWADTSGSARLRAKVAELRDRGII